MEEFIGEVWHKYISSKVATGFPEAGVELATFQSQLSTYFHCLGGAPGKVVEAAEPRILGNHRPLLQRIAGSHRRAALCWQDQRSLRLPPVIDYLPEKEQNEALYFWLAALGAKLSTMKHWFVENQLATLAILTSHPGLKTGYQMLAKAVVAQRPLIEHLPQKLQAREQAIQRAILKPGSVKSLPLAIGEPLFVPLWLYPAPLYNVGAGNVEDSDEQGASSEKNKTESLNSPRKSAQYFDDEKQTDGLLVFKLEALFSWAEQVDMDRSQQEDLDQDLQGAADDLDVITLSRKRKAGSAKVKFDMDLPAPFNDDLYLGPGLKLPEWNYKKRAMLKDFCFVQPMLSDEAVPSKLPENLKEQANCLKRQFNLLRPLSVLQRRQPFGDEIDLDAWLDIKTQPNAMIDGENLYLAKKKNARDMSTLVLADLSMSTDSGVTTEQRVVDVIRDSLLLFSEALSACDDPFAIYGFSSIKNKQIRFQLLKNFSEIYSDHTRGRILAIEPGFYTRMGAAIRQSVSVLKMQNSNQKLLLIISDGKPNDIDHYEGRYGIEDTRQAILEAKRQGIQPFCITIDAQANDYLPYLFGDQGYTLVRDIQQLPKMLPKLYLNLSQSI